LCRGIGLLRWVSGEGERLGVWRILLIALGVLDAGSWITRAGPPAVLETTPVDEFIEKSLL
jgi:hypothetical protein